MINKGLRTFDNQVGPVERPKQNSSRFKTSNPKNDTTPIDFILVYNPVSPSDEDKKSSTTPFYPPAQRREKYENYLIEKQNLELEKAMVTLNSIDQSTNFLCRTHRKPLVLSKFMRLSTFFYERPKQFECVCRSK